MPLGRSVDVRLHATTILHGRPSARWRSISIKVGEVIVPWGRHLAGTARKPRAASVEA